MAKIPSVILTVETYVSGIIDLDKPPSVILTVGTYVSGIIG